MDDQENELDTNLSPAVPPGNPLYDLVQRYLMQEDPYKSRLESALARRQKGTESLRDLYTKTLETKGEEGPSKSELYFRLAQAFLDPGKTGAFTESLGRAGGVAAEYGKEQRLARRQLAADRLKAETGLAELELEGAGEEAETYRRLSERGMQDRSAIAKELLEKIEGTGKAQSSAGKQAMDEGLTPGTPDFTARVRELSQQQTDLLLSRIGSLEASVALAGQRESRATETLSPQEVNLMVTTEDTINAMRSSRESLRNALEYSKLAFGNTAAEQAQYRYIAERDPNNSRVIATRNLQNLLSEQSLQRLKATFGGTGITDAERLALDRLTGANALSQRERDDIINRALNAADSRIRYNENRLNKIRKGEYRYRNTGDGK